jgi:O-antigen/teichoic acid export membrane protein
MGFIRSFVFMRVFDLKELGLISLIQTCIMFIGLFQIGLINGGYRIFAIGNSKAQQNVNNVLFSYFGIISILLLLICGIVLLTHIDFIINSKYLFITFVAGVATLMANWLTNTLIGTRRIKDINHLRLISNVVSLLSIGLVYVWGILGGSICILIQPLLFVSLALLCHKDLRPTKIYMGISTIKEILSVGFIPFLVSIFSVLNIQIERWSITYILGVESLGRFYLVFLFSSLFILIPGSLTSLFFPKVIYSYEHKQIPEFIRQMRNYSISLTIYGVLIVITIIFLLQPMVNFLFPIHSNNTRYVFFLIPGLIAHLVYYPITSILNSWRDFTPMFISGISGIVASVMIITITNYMEAFSLNTMVLIKDIAYFLPAICGGIYIYIHRNKFSIING